MKSIKSKYLNNKPKIIEGGIHIDQRGILKFFNDLNFFNFKRMYIIENFNNNFIRAWHGHKNESKLFYCASGSFKIGLVKINNFNNPNKNSKPVEFTISCKLPKFLYIPKGYANGSMNLETNSKLVVFSDKSLNESLNDDFRYNYDFWNIWNIKYE